MSLQFAKPTKAKITSVNARSENHGDQLVPAVDVRFEMDLPNAQVLPAYASELLDAMYDRMHVDAQSSIPDIGPANTHLRFPQLGPLKWKAATVHENLEIDYGMGGKKSNIELHQVKCHRHALALKEGGTVTVSFTVSASHVSEQAIGRLGVRVQHEVHVVLSAGAPLEDEGEEE